MDLLEKFKTLITEHIEFEDYEDFTKRIKNFLQEQYMYPGDSGQYILSVYDFQDAFTKVFTEKDLKSLLTVFKAHNMKGWTEKDDLKKFRKFARSNARLVKRVNSGIIAEKE